MRPSHRFIYVGSEPIQLTETDEFENYPRINDNGQVVYTANVANVGSEILFYDGTDIERITNNETGDYIPELSDDGEIVWKNGLNDNAEIIFFGDPPASPDIWGAPSVIEADGEAGSGFLGCLLMILLPVGMVGSLKWFLRK